MSPSSQSPQLLSLQNRLGYSFQDLQILKLALTHRSAGRSNNERLEFLGDSFVNHVIAQRLYVQFPKASEGQLTRLRSKLVRGTFLATLGEKYALGECLTLGVGERKSGGRHRSSILADTVEAVAGAILLDAGYEIAAPVILNWFTDALLELQVDGDKDSKTLLQEWLQARNLPLPNYDLVSVEGPDHAQEFEVACLINGQKNAFSGRGSSRRNAEQQAAFVAMGELGND
ncbi:MAG: ribonuclease III [Luminiphilus sp.]|nr:ribonuclease III [Luminiphilus sp.]